jgi:hypothetical protein
MFQAAECEWVCVTARDLLLVSNITRSLVTGPRLVTLRTCHRKSTDENDPASGNFSGDTTFDLHAISKKCFLLVGWLLLSTYFTQPHFSQPYPWRARRGTLKVLCVCLSGSETPKFKSWFSKLQISALKNVRVNMLGEVNIILFHISMIMQYRTRDENIVSSKR